MMKVMLATINAKYIHTSLAMRLLYVANNNRFDIDFREYTLKDDTERIAEDLLATGCDIVGLGVYIWNVRQCQRLTALLKAKQPDLIIILGGPEVTYEPSFFLDNWPVDYIVSGEGEFVLGELLEAIKTHRPVDIESVSYRGHISPTIAQADLAQIAALPSPYKLSEDREVMQNKVVYMETSRGCPFRCSYCLASVEKQVRYFPLAYVFDNLDYLIDNGVRQLKFLDRTFNLNQQHASAVFDFLINRYRPNMLCQFEIYADLLQEKMIDYLNTQLPPHYFRFEIGIQSTSESTNKAINRKQDYHLLATNIRKLAEGGKIDLHLDLIAGLPYESFAQIVQSFNDVFAFKAKEVQLGFLKMLRGTELRQHAAIYGYTYDDEAPYEVTSHAGLSEAEIDRLRRVAYTVEKYWNSGRFVRTMHALVNSYEQGKYFELFDELATRFFARLSSSDGACEGHESKSEITRMPRQYQLEDTFRDLHNFLLSKEIDLFTTLRTDYYHCFSTRPSGFWENTLDKKTRKRLLHEIGSDKDWLNRHHLTRKLIEKRTAIDPISTNEYQLTIFTEDKQEKYSLVWKR